MDNDSWQTQKQGKVPGVVNLNEKSVCVRSDGWLNSAPMFGSAEPVPLVTVCVPLIHFHTTWSPGRTFTVSIWVARLWSKSNRKFCTVTVSLAAATAAGEPAVAPTGACVAQ